MQMCAGRSGQPATPRGRGRSGSCRPQPLHRQSRVFPGRGHTGAAGLCGAWCVDSMRLTCGAAFLAPVIGAGTGGSPAAAVCSRPAGSAIATVPQSLRMPCATCAGCTTAGSAGVGLDTARPLLALLDGACWAGSSLAALFVPRLPDSSVAVSASFMRTSASTCAGLAAAVSAGMGLGAALPLPAPMVRRWACIRLALLRWAEFGTCVERVAIARDGGDRWRLACVLGALPPVGSSGVDSPHSLKTTRTPLISTEYASFFLAILQAWSISRHARPSSRLAGLRVSPTPLRVAADLADAIACFF